MKKCSSFPQIWNFVDWFSDSVHTYLKEVSLKLAQGSSGRHSWGSWYHGDWGGCLGWCCKVSLKCSLHNSPTTIPPMNTILCIDTIWCNQCKSIDMYVCVDAWVHMFVLPSKQTRDRTQFLKNTTTEESINTLWLMIR